MDHGLCVPPTNNNYSRHYYILCNSVGYTFIILFYGFPGCLSLRLTYSINTW